MTAFHYLLGAQRTNSPHRDHQKSYSHADHRSQARPITPEDEHPDHNLQVPQR